MMRVYQRFIQIKHQRFSLHQIETMSGHGRQWINFVFHRLMLHNLQQQDLNNTKPYSGSNDDEKV